MHSLRHKFVLNGANWVSYQMHIYESKRKLNDYYFGRPGNTCVIAKIKSYGIEITPVQFLFHMNIATK